ncbi:MAG: ATP-binding cassette domain-containing protein [Chloroflexota bacterium]|nr:ATP-binding cassette domain-containing protein [Chloroflexota bacterium]
MTKGLLFGRTTGALKAVDGVDFSIGKGESLALVGESGCGKTTTAKLILMLEKPTAGQILFRGTDISTLRGDGKAEYRKSVQAVFQDPWSSLNPRMKVRDIIGEPMQINLKLSREELRDRVGKLLEDVGLHAYQMDLYPHEFSGGQRQRIAVARALSLSPDLIVLDEPVSALDVSIRAQIMNLLKDLQAQYQVSYLLIAHNLATVRYMAHKVAVMYLGQIVEYGGHEVFDRPLHPYNKALISAALPSHPDIQRDEIILTGEVPSPVNPPKGCHFHPRCYAVRPYCSEIEPKSLEAEPGHYVSCHLYDPEIIQKHEGGIQPPTGPKNIQAM